VKLAVALARPSIQALATVVDTIPATEKFFHLSTSQNTSVFVGVPNL
jgi:hypothetical protein